MSDWRPIETCPGNKMASVWLVNDNPKDHKRYKDKYNGFPTDIYPYRGKKIIRYDGVSEFFHTLDDRMVFPKPTLWMPIEPPPAPWEKRELEERKQDGRPSVIPYDPAKGMPKQHRKHDELYYLEKIQGDIKCIAGALELQSESLDRMEKGLSTLRAQCIRIEGYADFLEMRTRAKRDFDSPAFTAGKDHLPR